MAALAAEGFFAQLEARAAEIDSVLCVGLDPHNAKTAADAERECIALIDATAEYACCFKPNSAFFEAFGGDGLNALKAVIARAQKLGALVVLDNKRGDIDSTAEKYAAASFDALGADCVTLSPYLGWDGLGPFCGAGTKHGEAGRGAFVLCATSNGSAKEVQSDALRAHVAAACLADGLWGAKTAAKARPLGLVVGATDLDALRKCRAVNAESWILAPGVGAQGASARDALLAGAAPGASTLAQTRIVVPVSRGISRAADAGAAAKALRDELRAAFTSASAAPAVLSAHQQAFLNCAVDCGALKFQGPYTLKSGRASPYFFNAGLVCSGKHIATMFDAYADALANSNLDFDVVFGPAYKGIPLCAGIAASLASRGRDVSFSYNRKEAKDHGEGGLLVGADVRGKRVVLCDDVISAGTAVREAADILKNAGAHLSAIIVALDRQEVTGAPGPNSERLSALASVAAEYKVPVLAIVTLTDLLKFLEGDADAAGNAAAVRSYRDEYGAC
ncbi:hypothetical protein M885DRAFT_528367 [Pelagophyceae sp. CCMP2097]|nr:hypothetical protein M885DRAFT_528367 [Pelagophyceae sp. CCMP2097]